MSTWTRPIALAAVAGSATAVGGALVLFLGDKPTDRTISFTLSFAAGVMVVVSILDLWLPIALLGPIPFILSTLCLLAGMAGTSLLSNIRIPEPEELIVLIQHGGVRPSPSLPSSHPLPLAGERTNQVVEEDHGGEDSRLVVEGALTGGEGGEGTPMGSTSAEALSKARSWRLGMLLALVLTVHNLPEGLAVGVSALKSKELGLLLATAIFLHNVAEGVVIAVPLLAATGNRWLALGITAASGMTEPLGAAIGVLVLRGLSNGDSFEYYLNIVLCTVGGVMLEVSRRELIPQAWRLGDERTVAWGFVVGGALIGLSIFLLGREV